jgi:hypothetical protein
MVSSLTLAELAVPNILNHGKILGIITTNKSIPNSIDVGCDISLEMISKTEVGAVGAIAPSDLCSRNQYEIPVDNAQLVKDGRKTCWVIWGNL